MKIYNEGPSYGYLRDEFEKLVINAHRVAFKMGIKIPEEIINFLDSLSEDRRCAPRHENIKHNNPEDYGLTNKDAYLAKIRFLRSQLNDEPYFYYVGESDEDGRMPIFSKYKNIVEAEKKIREESLNSRGWKKVFLSEHWKEIDEKINNIKKQISYYNKLLKSDDNDNKKKRYDVSTIKQIPIGSIYKVMPNGFFFNNPLRQEQSPSNSLYWNKNKNTWHDYGTGEYGDIIDLVQKVNKCNLPKACEILGT